MPLHPSPMLQTSPVVATAISPTTRARTGDHRLAAMRAIFSPVAGSIVVMLSTGSAAVIRQIPGGHIGFVLAFDGHLPRTGGVAAHPGDRNDRRIDHYR